MKNTMRLSTESLMEICRQCFPPRIGEMEGLDVEHPEGEPSRGSSKGSAEQHAANRPSRKKKVSFRPRGGPPLVPTAPVDGGGWAHDHLLPSSMSPEDLAQLEKAGYFPKGDGILPDSEEVRLDQWRRPGCIVAFSAWFHAGLCVPVHPFLLEFLETYGIELAQLHPLTIVRLNVFRWLCETVLHEEPSMKLLLFYFTMEVRELLTPDGFALSTFGSVNLRLRSGFGDDFLLKPRKSAEKLFVKWESWWFLLWASKTRLQHTGDLPRHSGAGGLREVPHPGEPRSADLRKVAKIKEVSAERSFRDLMEEMVMAGRFMMRSHPRSEIGIPRSFRPPQLVTAPTFFEERAALWAAQLIGPYGGPEHRDYETKISEGGCHNIIAKCFGKIVPMR
ncbi:uncharacterized protein LOC106866802 [Brachypodium distachyon]|uniref:uncharacterized protein LOC106866802 n=1 Tax=Brachypodium distachyon TaxID=15368 RepID=UPI000D0D633A|nr:uncharacterized protein LOC106866802 [Brachypodium distachyon]|eukprot:XP_024310683.1 uncharacterized protein LOC106866802 [Brachypodium distachyon]